ncbi:MAG: hypothetical protein RIS94_2469 [Pseudomonadota bacterium]|jgi:hypothetical protein
MNFRNAIAAVGATALLAACMLLPGRFDSDLAVHKDGTFAFHYQGEIILAPLAAPPQSTETDEAFEASPCTNEDTGEEHDCSAQELAKQKADWQAEQDKRKADKAAEDAKSRKAMAALMGGIDPSDPRAAQEFADRLSRQQGWKSVVSKGNGKFEVEYAIAGRLDHDFTFPTIERLPLVIPFVTVIRRNDGTVRVDAPAFTPGASNPQIPGLSDAGGKSQPSALDGHFALVTDAAVLANNTDEGPRRDPAGTRLEWKVNATTPAAPTALLRLAP